MSFEPLFRFTNRMTAGLTRIERARLTLEQPEANLQVFQDLFPATPRRTLQRDLQQAVSKRVMKGIGATHQRRSPISNIFEMKQGGERQTKPTSIVGGFCTQHGTYEGVALFGMENKFQFPKPEGLLRYIVEMATGPGDLILDSFAGSGTTGAVAHKMGRRWIMVELGEHCHTHITPRLKKVIDGEDPGGVTEAVGWKGGGGFRYYRLAPSLLEKDKWGNWVINKEYNAAMLTEAVCKLEGFQYAPSDAIYWQHGHSTERDFIYVTTAHLGHDQLQQLSDEVGPDRTLLVLCTAFRAKPDRYPNLTVKKVPKTVLSRCEWGHDDYSLRVENLPEAPPKPGQMDLAYGGGMDGGAGHGG